ncbi:DUF5050 domain-containing protein [Marinilactibacillus kalidii]|uniref:DUF5050 domain-containing protein n=1 Tax=Marinilactibacillus kalidii TaxID=2820274 RepID=UPI001ABE9455|nr:DUF5050 domain-containing protein [Marinilactibacillus kalidii]
MLKRKDEIGLAIRGIVLIFLPGLALVYLIYGMLFNVDLNYFTLGTGFVLYSFLKWFNDKYIQDDSVIKVEDRKVVETILQEGKWEVMDRGLDWLKIRPRFDFPFNYVVRDEVMIHFENQYATLKGPHYYIETVKDNLDGDQSMWEKKHPSFTKVMLYGILAILPILLDGGLYWEAKVMYHNVFASTNEVVETREETTKGNLIENTMNSGYGVETNEFNFYVENEERIIRTDKQFKEKQELVGREDPFGISNLNLVGDWLYYVDGSSIDRIRFDGTEKETIYGMGYTIDMQIMGDYIYFINEEQDSNIYRMNLNGENLERFLSVEASEFLVHDDHLLVTYLENEDEYNRITERVSLDTQKRTEVFSEDNDSIIEWEGYYYYRGINAELKRSLIADPTKTDIVVNSRINNYTIIDDTVYYSLDQDYLSPIYRSNLDGKETEKLNGRSNYINNFTKVGDIILFTSNDMNDNYEMKKIDPETGSVKNLEE